MNAGIRIAALLTLVASLLPGRVVPLRSASGQSSTRSFVTGNRFSGLSRATGSSVRLQQPRGMQRGAAAGPAGLMRHRGRQATASPAGFQQGFVPRHQRAASRQTFASWQVAGDTDGLESIAVPPPESQQTPVESETPFDAALVDPEWEGGDSCTGPDCGAEPCMGDCGWGCTGCCLIPCPQIPLDNLSLFSGVHGFKDPSNLDRDGSFGFQTGLNWGAPFWLFPYSGVGMQAGLQGVFSNFSGSNFTDDSRDQLYFTTGLFRRADWGLQGGVVYDYMRDNWYSEVTLNQIRGEISWVYPCLHEWGFWFTASSDSDQSFSPDDQQAQTWEPTDLYAFFYRRRFAQNLGGEGRFFAGFTQKSDGLIGADCDLPLSACWSLQTAFTYLIPEESRQDGGSQQEGWNVAINLVWYPRGNSSLWDGGNYYRPLLRVADRGSFFVDLLR